MIYVSYFRSPVMSSGTKSKGAENLFACTSCHGKFSFDQLSHGEQLCKVCLSLRYCWQKYDVTMVMCNRHVVNYFLEYNVNIVTWIIIK